MEDVENKATRSYYISLYFLKTVRNATFRASGCWLTTVLASENKKIQKNFVLTSQAK